MRELKGRIGSVQSSQKITGAMKMISSAKLRKAEQALHGMAPYREQLQLTINNLLEADREYESPWRNNDPYIGSLLFYWLLTRGFAVLIIPIFIRRCFLVSRSWKTSFPGNLPLTFIRSGKRLFRQLIVPRVSICASVIIFMQKVHPMN